MKVLFWHTKINELLQILVRSGAGTEPRPGNLDQKEPESEP